MKWPIVTGRAVDARPGACRDAAGVVAVDLAERAAIAAAAVAVEAAGVGIAGAKTAVAA